LLEVPVRRSIIFLCAFTASASIAVSATARDVKLPRLHTNQAYVEDVIDPTGLAIDDPMAVFAYVLASLPERVKVYPTENHYYFVFFHNGTRYAGNIKIDARLREQGKVAFAYYEERAAGVNEAAGIDLVLDSSRGVTVEKVESLAYRVTYGKKSVVFALNDLSQVRPPAEALAPDEQFIGPVFDESGVRFFLVFNTKLKVFHYILDETVEPADAFVPVAAGQGRILIGKRTAFAVYRDHRRERKILIGVYEGNVRANNYIDGPFDQMPDNFIEGDSFRQALLMIEPSLKGEIDRYGGFADGSRLVVAPYMQYSNPKDLTIFHRCAISRRIPAASYYRCFALPHHGTHSANARPLAMQR
jgi:hypothetical protein